MRSLSARDIALSVKGGSLLRRQGKGVAVAAARRYRHRQRQRHLNHRHLQNGAWNRTPKWPMQPFEQQGESKRRREHPEVPQAADSSSSSKSSTDTEMGLVDVCTILCDISEAEGRCEGGPITLDLTKWDFSKADCRNKCRKLVENSKRLLLIGSPIDSGQGNKERARGFCKWHSSASCTKHNCTGVGISFTHTHVLQTVGNLTWERNIGRSLVLLRISSRMLVPGETLPWSALTLPRILKSLMFCGLNKLLWDTKFIGLDFVIGDSSLEMLSWLLLDMTLCFLFERKNWLREHVESVCPRNESHCWTSAFNDHVDHSFVIFKYVQLRLTLRG